MKAFMTKYAMTKGIKTVRVSDSLLAEYKSVCGHCGIVHVKFIHSTEEAARNHAKEMQDAHIKSLKKQIAKAEKIDFDTAPITKF